MNHSNSIRQLIDNMAHTVEVEEEVVEEEVVEVEEVVEEVEEEEEVVEVEEEVEAWLLPQKCLCHCCYEIMDSLFSFFNY